METMQLLTLGLAAVFLLAVFEQNTRRTRARPALRRLIIEVSDPQVARRALFDHADAFSSRPFTPFPVAFIAERRRGGRRRGHTITTVPYGPHWRALRCNLNDVILHPLRHCLLAPLQQAAIDSLVAALSAQAQAGRVVAVRDWLHDAMFSLVARLCFGDGVDARDVRSIQHLLKEFLSFIAVVEAKGLAHSRLARLLYWRRWRRFVATRDHLAALFLPLIEKSRSRRSGGVHRPYVDGLLDVRVPSDDGEAGIDVQRALTDDELVNLVWEFLHTAADTVVNCLEWTLAHLVSHPDAQEKLFREVTSDEGDGAAAEERLRGMPYLRAVVLESLRLHPPVATLTREVRAAGAMVGGTAVPPGGAMVNIKIGLIGRDSSSWTEPDEFRPERFLAGGEGEDVGPVPGTKKIRMMPFGAGRRSCPGMALGMLHVKCFLTALVREFEWAPPANGGVDLTELDGFFKVLKTPLTARITPRRRSP
ncbi:hypothetical protein ACP70R_023586 [Stipagrostis hirtigluma subsp. patula]